MPTKLVITIDTEEDNWGDYSADSFGIENIKKIPLLQQLFDEFNIIPTYLVTYPVATNKASVRILQKIHQQGRCEIGMHCHPWSTPPIEEERNPYNSMLCNLPYDLQKKKLRLLHEAIEKNIGVKATSFRAGRWGYSGSVSMAIKELGYTVDTSITPFTDWSVYNGPNFFNTSPEPYKFNPPNILDRLEKGQMIEIPATIGYLQHNFKLCGSIDRCLTSHWGKAFRLKGILNGMKLLNKVWLSPEASNVNQMVKLSKVLIKKRYKIINLFFHSTSLLEGLNDIIKTKEDKSRFMNSLKKYFIFTKRTEIKSIRLSQPPWH